MGLTLHYTLRSSARTIKEARDLLRKLHKAATKLPFKFVTDIDEYVGDQCDYEKRPPHDAERWTLAQAVRYIEQDGQTYSVPPIRVMAFITTPGEGADPAIFGLCRYPRTIENIDGEKIPTHLGGAWSWSSFCKTQYASDPRYGGKKNFLKCHLLLVRILDEAEKIGFTVEVHDEGNYWENRDEAALAKTVKDWNAMVAGFVGRIKDHLTGQSVHAPITNFPDYEHLEAEGRAGEDPDEESNDAEEDEEQE